MAMVILVGPAGKLTRNMGARRAARFTNGFSSIWFGKVLRSAKVVQVWPMRTASPTVP